MSDSKGTVPLMINGKRTDGREVEDLRNLRIEVGIIPEADGSAYVEWGGNKIVCGVYGPRECIPRHDASPYHSIVKCRYMMSPFASLEEHSRSGPSRRSTELSKVIREVFENVVIAEKFPNTQIDIYIDVLQADGGTRTASITAATVALANAGIPMKDMVASVAVGKAGDTLVLDLNKAEDNFGQSDMPMAMSQKDKKLLLLQMDGLLTKEEVIEMVGMAERGCEKVNAIQTSALKRFYEKGEDETVKW
ncbi:Exosome complex component Rrp41 [Candidatus Bilamarchaeum dharawalense]|uniref:Exosome complex component Rrp41 n=1 Tax=Candidatus Bilamarchaeum dharawalense TaxID=2885759 RepID=A0A5E4LYF1_9ARCH|nr:Exosome complex component Rrp41 [Candidatus Bilamarchaeum dharawalense]